ncbi:hypothetical protein, partial [Lactiplantibacillus plantarum]|uniref:hypothetical protein n=1 Tax=Lactiplantibacillus plantarum TaxID=1590 RepID=UPI001BAD75D6
FTLEDPNSNDLIVFEALTILPLSSGFLFISFEDCFSLLLLTLESLGLTGTPRQFHSYLNQTCNLLYEINKSRSTLKMKLSDF